MPLTVSMQAEIDALTGKMFLRRPVNLIKQNHALASILLAKANREYKKTIPVTFGLEIDRLPAKWLSGPYDTFADGGRTLTTTGSMDWSKLEITLEATGDELVQQHGVDLGKVLNTSSLSELPEEVAITLMSTFNTAVRRQKEDFLWNVGDAIYNGLGTSGTIFGLDPIIRQTTTAYAGLTPSDFSTDPITSNSFWTPQRSHNSGTLREVDANLISQTISKIFRVSNGDDNKNHTNSNIIALCNLNVWNRITRFLKSDFRYSAETEYVDMGLQSFGYDLASFVRDDLCPNNFIYFLNLDYLELYLCSTRDENNFQGWSKAQRQDLITGETITNLMLLCKNRHLQAVIEDAKGIND